MVNKSAFVIMSFNEKYDRIYHQAIRPAFNESGYNCNRVDENFGPGNISHEAIKAIINSDIVLAEISENSPNVFYELGVSHSVGNKTITIISNINNIPFDVSHYRAICYANDNAGLRLLKNDIKAAIENLEQTNMMVPNNLAQEAGREYFDLRLAINEKLNLLLKEIKRTKAFSKFREKNGYKQDNSDVAWKIVEKILMLLPGISHTILICICGGGAVGKSTFAELLKSCILNLENPKLTVDILPTDSYVLSRAERILKNIIGSDPRATNLNKLCEDVESLVSGKEIFVTPYDHSTGKHLPEKKVVPSNILILEGIYSFYAPIIPLLKKLKYFIYADKSKLKELKLIADFTERGHDIQTAFEHADIEYSTYETYIFPYLKIADYIITVDEYWRYEGPTPQQNVITIENKFNI